MVTEQAISKRKWVESACGYPEEYGGDNVLLATITGFLKSRDIADEVNVLRREYAINESDPVRHEGDVPTDPAKP